MKTKPTYEDYVKAHYTIEEYNKEINRFFRKEGVKYIRCEHLKNKTQEAEVGLLWIGDSTRVVQCPICLNVDLGNFMRLLETQIPLLAVDDVPEENKKPVAEGWKDKFRLFFKSLRRHSGDVV